MDLYMRFSYKNHRGEITPRHVRFRGFDWMANPGYDYQPGWFITGYDMDKKKVRSFSIHNVVFTVPTQGKVFRLPYSEGELPSGL